VPSQAEALALLPRHWRSYNDDALPTPMEALAEPFAAFQSWFLRIECDRSVVGSSPRWPLRPPTQWNWATW